MSDMQKNYEKMCTLKFDINTYSLLENNITRNGKITENKLLHMQKLPCRTATKITCVCCNRHMQKHVCKMYNKVDYDFTSFLVSQCLQHISNSVHEEQYICSSCDKILKETNDETQLYNIYTE